MGLPIKELLNVAENILKRAGDSDYKTDATLIICHLLHYDDQKLFMNWSKELEDVYCEAYLDLVQRRADGEPTQYIIGKAWFMDIVLSVDNRVLIPRNDTETLVVEALSWLDSHGRAKQALDLGAGSGAIAISLAKKKPGLKITASDISREALTLAEENVKKNGAGNIKFVKSDLFVSMRKGTFGQKYDIIVSNPPYIKSEELPSLDKEIFEHEPMIALDGGPDGLEYIKRIITEAPEYLKKDGALFLEIGSDQAIEVCRLFVENGKYKEPQVKKDLAGNDRVVFAGLG